MRFCEQLNEYITRLDCRGCWAVPLKISATAPPTAGGCRIGCWAAMRPGRTASPAS